MRNWKTLEADVNMIMNTHYTSGRGGRKIDKIVVHHNAGNLSVKDCYDLWQKRAASAHYQVDANGRIGQLVWDKDTAWQAGNWDANTTSIGIEHADISSSPWRISEATLDNGAHLVAALCHHYKLGRPTWRKNVFPHNAFTATECPASIAGTQQAAYMARAQKWYDQMAGTTTTTKTDDIESMVNIMKATHIIFQYKTALGIANVLAGTYHLYGNEQDYKDNVYAMKTAGAKVKTWGELRGKTGADANKVDNPHAFGIQQ